MAATNVNYTSHDNVLAIISKIKTTFAKLTDVKVDTIQVNGTTLTPTNKVVNITMPTKVSDLTNDSSFQENVIETVKVNGTALAVTDKAVNVVVPQNVEDGAEVNQNAFSNITVGETTVAAGTKTDTFELEAGTNVQISAAGKKITLTATDTTYSAATASQDGLLTSGDFTKLKGVAAGAEVNTIDTITVGGDALTPTGKTVALGSAAGATVAGSVANDATVPTGAAVQNYVNSLDFQTSTQVSDAISTAIAAIQGISFEVVNSVEDLPATGEVGTFYLVPNSGSSPNAYDEYIWLAGTPGRYEKVGQLELDLSNYLTNDNFVELTQAQIDSMFA